MPRYVKKQIFLIVLNFCHTGSLIIYKITQLSLRDDNANYTELVYAQSSCSACANHLEKMYSDLQFHKAITNYKCQSHNAPHDVVQRTSWSPRQQDLAFLDGWGSDNREETSRFPSRGQGLPCSTNGLSIPKVEIKYGGATVLSIYCWPSLPILSMLSWKAVLLWNLKVTYHRHRDPHCRGSRFPQLDTWRNRRNHETALNDETDHNRKDETGTTVGSDWAHWHGAAGFTGFSRWSGGTGGHVISIRDGRWVKFVTWLSRSLPSHSLERIFQVKESFWSLFDVCRWRVVLTQIDTKRTSTNVFPRCFPAYGNKQDHWFWIIKIKEVINKRTSGCIMVKLWKPGMSNLFYAKLGCVPF